MVPANKYYLHIQMQTNTRSCVIFQETDLKYLVDEVWKTRSALSCHDNIYDLTLLRWNKVEVIFSFHLWLKDYIFHPK